MPAHHWHHSCSNTSCFSPLPFSSVLLEPSRTRLKVLEFLLLFFQLFLNIHLFPVVPKVVFLRNFSHSGAAGCRELQAIGVLLGMFTLLRVQLNHPESQPCAGVGSSSQDLLFPGFGAQEGPRNVWKTPQLPLWWCPERRYLKNNK